MATAQRVTLSDGATTWTVIDRSFGLVEPVEAYLEYGRQIDFRPNTTRAYAQSLAQWWSFLEVTGTSWDAVKLHDFGDFISALRYGELDSPVRELRPRPTLSDSTVNLRMRAVMSFYRYQADSGTDAAPFLWKQAHVRSGRYLSFLEHVARRAPQKRTAIRIRAARKAIPVLAPTRSTPSKAPRPPTTQHSRSGEVTCDIGSCGQSWRNRACGSAKPSRWSTATGTPGSAARAPGSRS